ncbi:MAG: hypothetical protein IPK19_20895 [Chloroflexi bacterium]|nr:hypothetical protein [Chloroflexota bacterium]
MQVDGTERRTVAWADWAITTRIDTHAVLSRVWEAVQCHQSQVGGFEGLLRLDDDGRARIFGVQTYYRAFSLVNGGRAVESDLFEGLRAPQPALRVPS